MINFAEQPAVEQEAKEQPLDNFILQPYEKPYEGNPGFLDIGLELSGEYNGHQYHLRLKSGRVPVTELNETNIRSFAVVEAEVDGVEEDAPGRGNIQTMQAAKRFVADNLLEIYYRGKLREVERARVRRKEMEEQKN